MPSQGRRERVSVAVRESITTFLFQFSFPTFTPPRLSAPASRFNRIRFFAIAAGASSRPRWYRLEIFRPAYLAGIAASGEFLADEYCLEAIGVRYLQQTHGKSNQRHLSVPGLHVALIDLMIS